jgi:CDP-glucose 4,6-dehydratase
LREGYFMRKEFWKGRSVFVTGATGLLGGWLVKELTRNGAQVVALVRDGSPGSMLVRDGLINQIRTVHGSLADRSLLMRTMAEYEAQTVFHLAAQTIVGVAKVDPIGTLEANVEGSWNLLEAARNCNVSQVVVASSDKAYGEAPQLPYVETHPMRGKYPYDVSKSCMDLIAGMYATTYDLPVAIVRCGNLFGGGDLNFSRSVPGVISATLRGERFLMRSDGAFIRDFLYVEDAVDAYLLLAERMAQDRSLMGEGFNFSLEARMTMLELVRMVLQMMGRTDLEPVIQNIASSEIREQYMSADKARRRLGWSARYGMSEGLWRTIAWYRDHLSQQEANAQSDSAALAS